MRVHVGSRIQKEDLAALPGPRAAAAAGRAAVRLAAARLRAEPPLGPPAGADHAGTTSKFIIQDDELMNFLMTFLAVFGRILGSFGRDVLEA